MLKKIKNKLRGDLLRNFLLMTFATFIGRGIGFFKEIFVAKYFGVSIELDILLFSYALAGTLMGILSGAMQSTVLPKYLYYKNNHPQNKNTYLFAVFLVFLVILFILFLVIHFFGQEILILVSPGFSEVDQSMANRYLQLFFIYIFFIFIGTFFMIMIKAEKKFFFSGIVTSFIPASTLISVFFFHELGVISILYGVLVGAFLQFIFSWVKAKRFFTFQEVKISETITKYREIFYSYGTMVGSGLFIGLIGLTDQTFATLAGEGGVSSLSYASRLPALLDGLVLVVLGTVLFSSFSEHASYSRHKENKKLYLQSITYAFIGSLFLVIILSFFSKELITLIFMRGKFDLETVMMVYPIQIAFFLKLPFLAIAVISARMMNTLGIHREMLYINIFSFLLNGVLDYIFVTNYGVVGIAYATFFTYIWAATLNYAVTIRRIKLNIYEEKK